uniref:Uncharacterized protein n=1 Tax=Setaria italica TaxID=4555 RepID=K3YS52_SETIT
MQCKPCKLNNSTHNHGTTTHGYSVLKQSCTQIKLEYHLASHEARASRLAVAMARGGGPRHRRERDHRLHRLLLHAGGERVIPPEQLRHHQPPHCHRHVLPGALLVALRGHAGLRAVRPHHVLQQPLPLAVGAGGEAVGDELAAALEHVLIARRQRLVPEQHLPFLDLVRGVVALHDHVAPRAAVLEPHRRVHAQRLPDHRLHQRHLLHGGEGDGLGGVRGDDGSDLAGEPGVQLRAATDEPFDEVWQEELVPAVRVEDTEEDEVVEELIARDGARIGLLGILEDAGGDVGEVRRELGVVAAHEERREAEGMEEQVLERPRLDGLARERVELEHQPLVSLRRGAVADDFGRWRAAEQGGAGEVEHLAVVVLVELVGAGRLEAGFDAVEHGGEGGAERRRDVVHSRSGEADHDALERRVARVGGVEEREREVAAEERERGHVGAVERAGLVDTGVVEQDAEAARVEESNDTGVAGD